MPWKRRNRGFRLKYSLLLALAVAVAGGILASLLGSLLDKSGSKLASQQSALKALIGNRSPSEIKAALEKRGIRVR